MRGVSIVLAVCNGCGHEWKLRVIFTGNRRCPSCRSYDIDYFEQSKILMPPHALVYEESLLRAQDYWLQEMKGARRDIDRMAKINERLDTIAEKIELVKKWRETENN